MSTQQLDPLQKEHTDPFDPRLGRDVAVRIFTEKSGWYLGMSDWLEHEGDFLLLRLNPFIRFGHHKDHRDPESVNDVIFDIDDRPIKGSLRTDQLPFKLKNPQLVVHNEDPEDVLVIRFEGGAAILSVRFADIQEVLHAIKLLESFGV